MDTSEIASVEIIGDLQIIKSIDGDVEYFKNWKLHREDGPAIEYKYGERQWYKNGNRHRIDGPAIEYSNGNKEWWVNGKLHRLDGPAVERGDGRRPWWVEGEPIDCSSQEEFERLIKIRAFI